MLERKPVRILLLADYGDVGGTRTYIKQLLELYAEQAAKVVVATTHEVSDPEMSSLCALNGFGFVAISDVVAGGVPQGRLPGRLLRERALLRPSLSSGRFDMVVASVGTPEMFLGIFGQDIPALYILHTYPEKPRNSLKAFFKRACLAVLLRRPFRLLTVSRYSLERVREVWGIRGAGVAVVHNTAGPALAPVRRTFHAGGEVVVLTVGHVEDYKDPMAWIDIAEQVVSRAEGRSFRFIWVGPGSMLDVCRGQVRARGLDRSVQFVGARDANGVAAAYGRCDIYLQTSRIESLGLSVLDAMRRSLPCVVSDAGGLPELVVNGVSGWILRRPLDPQGAADRLIELGLQDADRLTMGEQAGRRYVELFAELPWRRAVWQQHQRAMQRDASHCE